MIGEARDLQARRLSENALFPQLSVILKKCLDLRKNFYSQTASWMNSYINV